MGQSSNYKQYNRTTRILTEESGFAGGMLWTGNNIDETHLKAIVNCDYDDTTGYLKSRDPFIPVDNINTFESNITGINENDQRGYQLLCTHNICAFDSYDDTVLDAGQLYIFTKAQTDETLTRCAMNEDSIVCIYNMYDTYYQCNLNILSGITLRNIIPANILLNYDNQLFGLGGYTDTEELSEENKEVWLNVYRLVYDKEYDTYTFDQRAYTMTGEKDAYVKPRIDSVTLLEACVSGFNAARGKATFTYGSEEATDSDDQRILGVYFKDEEGNDIVSPRAGQIAKIFVPTSYIKGDGINSYLSMYQAKESTKVSTTDLDDSWTHVNTDESADGMFEFSFQFQKKKTVLGFTFHGKNKPTETAPSAYSDTAVDYLMPYTVVAGDQTSNLKLKSYDLTTADGSCIWRNRMCVWGVEGNHNSLLLSEVDNFYYYPVPNNVALFDTNVISCIPYKDSLLVFTANKIYRISENNDGSFIQTVIQNDMPLDPKDSAQLTAIKNMVLFKSGPYFYMIVPKSQSLTDELSIAPIYKNIAGFLNTLDKSVKEVLQLLYPEYLFTSCTVSTSPTGVYSEQDTVHILYDVRANVSFNQENGQSVSATQFFKLFLNYNTNLRAWTLYIEDTTNASLEIASLTAARIMSFVRVHNDVLDEKWNFDVVTQRNLTEKSSSFRLLLDTGYRTLSTAVQKRFREVQLKIHNEDETITAFGTAFLVDGVWRRNYSKLQETILENNVVSLMPVMDLNTFVTELSMPVQTSGEIEKAPGSDAIELSDWTLDFSHFKREAPTTIRVPVSGKGFSPRFIFMAPNAAGLTINEINWVYRSMYGR